MTPLPFRRRLAAAALIITFAAPAWPAPAAGQEADPEMIPRDVAEALIAGEPLLDGGGEVRILVGRLPEQLAGVLPADPAASVVGSVVRRYMTEAVLDLPGTPDDVLIRWEEELLDGGWTRLHPQRFPSSGGFASSPPGRGYQFCMGDSLGVSLGADRHDGGSRLRVLMPRDRSAYNVCRHEREQARVQRTDDSPLPHLSAPAGVRMRGVGGGGGGSRYDSRALAETDMPVAELAAHFHRQLVDAGWEALGEAAGDDVVAYRYRVLDGTRDTPWVGILSVVRGHDADERYLSLQAHAGDRW